MRILHVIPAVAARYGGPSAAIFGLVAALNSIPGMCAEIATTDADGPNGHLTARDLPSGVTVHMLRQTWSEQWKVSVGLWRWLDQHVAEYDLVHIHAVWSFATAAAARAAQRHAIPYILRPAGMFSPYSWNRQGWKKQLYWRAIEQRTVRAAAGLHVTSAEESAEVRALRSDARVFMIPNGVDPSAFTWPVDASMLRRRCGTAVGDRPIVLFLSRLHPKKGIIDLLLPAASNMCKSCFIAIVGDADSHAPEHAAEVQKAVASCGLQDRVALLEGVSGNERWAMFDGADVFVLPSHTENFGIVVAEAMSRGCPVVVTDTVQSCDHVKAASAGEVVPRDAAALAQALDNILSRPELGKVYGQAGRAYARQHFCWDAIAKQVCQMYHECRVSG